MKEFMTKKEILNEKYNLAFHSESFNLGYNLYKKIENKLNNFNLFVFLLSMLILTAMVNVEKFFVYKFNEKIFMILTYGMLIILIYSIWNMLFYKVSFDSKVIKLIDSKLYNETKNKKSQIENYFFDRDNIEKIMSCMNYCKVEFNKNFSLVETRVSTVDLAELLIKSFKNKDMSEIINNSIQIKSEVQKVLNEPATKELIY